jgi:hypothetical protein
MTQRNELELAVEQARAKNFPHLPADLVRDVLRIEAECIANRAQALPRIQEVVDKYVSEEG